MPCRNLGLVDKDALGQIVPAKETNELASIFAPMGLMMLMLMVVMVGATPLLQGVLEEKPTVLRRCWWDPFHLFS